MVTAELAVAISVVVLVLATCLAAIGVAVDQVMCVDAARIAARAAARGDPAGQVRSLALAAAPDGARVQLHEAPAGVAVTVSVRVGGWGGLLPSWTVSAVGVTPREMAR
jgi:hypothetical protein